MEQSGIIIETDSASVTERRFCAPAPASGGSYDHQFDPRYLVRRRRDLTMGEAFDRACTSFRNFGSAVPEIIANLIIQAAKNGERDPGRLYDLVSKNFGVEDISAPIVSVGSIPVPPILRSHTQRDLREPAEAARAAPAARPAPTARVAPQRQAPRRAVISNYGTTLPPQPSEAQEKRGIGAFTAISNAAVNGRFGGKAGMRGNIRGRTRNQI